MFKTYFEEAKNIGKDDVLSEVIKETGLDQHKAKQEVQNKDLQQKIKREAMEGPARGVHGVPHFDIYMKGINDANPMSFSGAQPPSVFLNVFQKLLAVLKSKA